MVILGYLLLFVGCISAIVGEVMLLAVAYKRSVPWFFGCLILPVFWLAFLCLNPKLTIKPFCYLVFGLTAGWFGGRFTGIEF